MFNEHISFSNPNRQAKIGNGYPSHKGIASNFHTHPELEFLYMVRGEYKFGIDDNEYFAKKGELVFINSNVPHWTECMVEGTICQLIQFRNPSVIKTEFEHLSKFLRQNAPPFHKFNKGDAEYDEMLACVLNMVNSAQINDISHDYYVTANIYMMISLLHKKKLLPIESELINLNYFNKIAPVIKHIDTFHSEELSLSSLAKISNLNAEYLCRLFKKAIGATITEYINFVRICKADEYLRTDKNLSEIANSVGFSSLSYFNRIFKKYKYCSPTEYRKTFV